MTVKSVCILKLGGRPTLCRTPQLRNINSQLTGPRGQKKVQSRPTRIPIQFGEKPSGNPVFNRDGKRNNKKKTSLGTLGRPSPRHLVKKKKRNRKQNQTKQIPKWAYYLSQSVNHMACISTSLESRAEQSPRSSGKCALCNSSSTLSLRGEARKSGQEGAKTETNQVFRTKGKEGRGLTAWTLLGSTSQALYISSM